MLLKNRTDKFKELKQILANNNILTKEEECYCYAQDATVIKNKTILPDLVVFAETIEDVQNIVKYANQHEIPIIARGAGTNMVGACTTPFGGIVLNFSKMNKILNINEINQTITVQPGVVLEDLKEFVEHSNLYFPPDPSNYKVSTIGGCIAQSSSGASSFKYGTIKDYVLSLKVVMSDGELVTLGVNLTKNTNGYHLNQLIVGSEGTLGIIVEATLKLIAKPETKQLIVAYFNEIEDGINAVNNIIKQNIIPSAIEFMDKNSLITVENYMHSGLKTDYNYLFLIELDGKKSFIEEDTKTVTNILNKSNSSKLLIAKEQSEMDKIWMNRRASFAATSKLAPNVMSDDIIVPRENISHMAKACIEIANKYNLKLCLVGHIGDGNLHPQIALNINDEQEYRNYTQAKSEIYDFVLKLKGNISSEHGIGLSKKEYLSYVVDEKAINLMKIIKKGLDPKNILNPGKIFEL